MIWIVIISNLVPKPCINHTIINILTLQYFIAHQLIIQFGCQQISLINLNQRNCYFNNNTSLITLANLEMGNQLPSFAYSNNMTIPQNCKLYSILPIGSPSQEQHMQQILEKRSKLAQCPYICTVKGYDFVNEQSGRITCGLQKKLVVYYDNFDYRLTELSIKNYKKQFNQSQLCNLIRCITEGLSFLRSLRLHHGDVSLENICRKGKDWRLIDKVFIKNGINAYEKVLEGQSGFISPKQMIRIRYGFVKQSPDLTEEDDIFGLGMVILQLASGVPSSLCYKQMNVRFNEDILNQNLQICNQHYSAGFNQILRAMLNLEQQYRITLAQILMHPLIKGKRVQNHMTGNSGMSNSGTNQQKLRANYVKQNLTNVKSNVNLGMGALDLGRKPLTPTTTYKQQQSIMVPNTPRTPVGNAKSSHNYQNHGNQRLSHTPGSFQRVINNSIYTKVLSPTPSSSNNVTIYQNNPNKRVINFNPQRVTPQRLKTTY